MPETECPVRGDHMSRVTHDQCPACSPQLDIHVGPADDFWESPTCFGTSVRVDCEGCGHNVTKHLGGEAEITERHRRFPCRQPGCKCGDFVEGPTTRAALDLLSAEAAELGLEW